MKRKLTIAALCAAMTFLPASALHAGCNDSTIDNGFAAADGPQMVVADRTQEQNEEPTSRSEWLPEFSAVYVSAAIDIRFIQVAESEAPRIVYDTKGVADTKFKAFVNKQGELNITERILRDTRSQTTVEVYFHHLSSIEVSDACAEFEGTLKQTMLKVDVAGGAKFTADMDVTDLEVVLSGKATRAKLTGQARYVEIEASSGRLDASALEAMSVEVTASYGAGVAVRAGERLKSSATTSATISYRGAPTVIKGRSSVLGGTVKNISDED